MDFFYAGGNLFSEVVPVSGREVCDGCFCFKCQCHQPVFLVAVYVVFWVFFEEFSFILCELNVCVVYNSWEECVREGRSFCL